MKKIKNWTYEQGMQRLAWWKEEGSEVSTVVSTTCIHCYRDGHYMGTMDDKNHTGGHKLQQEINHVNRIY